MYRSWPISHWIGPLTKLSASLETDDKNCIRLHTENDSSAKCSESNKKAAFSDAKDTQLPKLRCAFVSAKVADFDLLKPCLHRNYQLTDLQTTQISCRHTWHCSHFFPLKAKRKQCQGFEHNVTQWHFRTKKKRQTFSCSFLSQRQSVTDQMI